ncbi:hypothetical protein SNEBB_003767 [Seison nebaliae]|nr:hypothetical protein SNEBB_003767 [Seison nebaliae]
MKRKNGKRSKTDSLVAFLLSYKKHHRYNSYDGELGERSFISLESLSENLARHYCGLISSIDCQVYANYLLFCYNRDCASRCILHSTMTKQLLEDISDNKCKCYHTHWRQCYSKESLDQQLNDCCIYATKDQLPAQSPSNQNNLVSSSNINLSFSFHPTTTIVIISQTSSLTTTTTTITTSNSFSHPYSEKTPLANLLIVHRNSSTSSISTSSIISSPSKLPTMKMYVSQSILTNCKRYKNESNIYPLQIPNNLFSDTFSNKLVIDDIPTNLPHLTSYSQCKFDQTKKTLQSSTNIFSFTNRSRSHEQFSSFNKSTSRNDYLSHQRRRLQKLRYRFYQLTTTNGSSSGAAGASCRRGPVYQKIEKKQIDKHTAKTTKNSLHNLIDMRQLMDVGERSNKKESKQDHPMLISNDEIASDTKGGLLTIFSNKKVDLRMHTKKKKKSGNGEGMGSRVKKVDNDNKKKYMETTYEDCTNYDDKIMNDTTLSPSCLAKKRKLIPIKLCSNVKDLQMTMESDDNKINNEENSDELTSGDNISKQLLTRLQKISKSHLADIIVQNINSTTICQYLQHYEKRNDPIQNRIPPDGRFHKLNTNQCPPDHADIKTLHQNHDNPHVSLDEEETKKLVTLGNLKKNEKKKNDWNDSMDFLSKQNQFQRDMFRGIADQIQSSYTSSAVFLFEVNQNISTTLNANGFNLYLCVDKSGSNSYCDEFDNQRKTIDNKFLLHYRPEYETTPILPYNDDHSLDSNQRTPSPSSYIVSSPIFPGCRVESTDSKTTVNETNSHQRNSSICETHYSANQLFNSRDNHTSMESKDDKSSEYISIDNDNFVCCWVGRKLKHFLTHDIHQYIDNEEHSKGMYINNNIAKSVMAFPLLGNFGELIGVVEFYRRYDVGSFTEEDVEMYQNMTRQRKLNDFLLTVTKSIFQDMVSIDVVIAKIMDYAKRLVEADRASLFLIDFRTNELYSRIFDLGESEELNVAHEFQSIIDEDSDHKDSDNKMNETKDNQLSQLKGENKKSQPNDLNERKSAKEAKMKVAVRFPLNKGVAGYVATTGETLNITDAYSDPRFNREVDDLTNYKTNTILCMPITIRGCTIGVVEMINKQGGFFTTEDEEAFSTFAVYCGLALHHAKLYEKIRRSEQKLKIALEVLSYHAACSQDEYTDYKSVIQRMGQDTMKSTYDRLIIEKLPINNYLYSTWDIRNSDKPLSVYYMYKDLLEVYPFNCLQIDDSTLLKFALTIRKNYRPVAYHNWDHGLSVAHTAYSIFKQASKEQQFTDLEVIVIFTACLSHDLDHRGRNNEYMAKSLSPLSYIYSTSLMEHHHFNQTVSILQNDSLNIFKHMSSRTYKHILSDIKHCILATDLAQFFNNRSRLQSLVSEGIRFSCSGSETKTEKLVIARTTDVLEKPHEPSLMSTNISTENLKQFDWEQAAHRREAMTILMTACDLCANFKPWSVTRRVTTQIMEEFWSQGDEEKRRGEKPNKMMDRTFANELPQNQIDFLSNICSPCYDIMSQLIPSTKVMYEGIQRNIKNWKKELAQGK